MNYETKTCLEKIRAVSLSERERALAYDLFEAMRSSYIPIIRFKGPFRGGGWNHAIQCTCGALVYRHEKHSLSPSCGKGGKPRWVRVKFVKPRIHKEPANDTPDERAHFPNSERHDERAAL